MPLANTKPILHWSRHPLKSWLLVLSPWGGPCLVSMGAARLVQHSAKPSPCCFGSWAVLSDVHDEVLAVWWKRFAKTGGSCWSRFLFPWPFPSILLRTFLPILVGSRPPLLCHICLFVASLSASATMRTMRVGPAYRLEAPDTSAGIVHCVGSFAKSAKPSQIWRICRMMCTQGLDVGICAEVDVLVEKAK